MTIEKHPGINSIRILLAAESEEVAELSSQLIRCGFTCSITSGGTEDIIDRIYEFKPDVILITGDRLPRLARQLKREKAIPVIGLVGNNTISDVAIDRSVDDFIIKPYDVIELELRIRRLLRVAGAEGELLRTGDLIIDLAKAEVSVAGREVLLTFKEYELLKFLVSNKGRVFTREALLDKVWGYDYFGGDRTVDVHIRRLRAKIEDSKHSFIETVRSIGYRFKEEQSA
jgi:DNA-binding response OmpR family regulator